jgi:hypothetical protein
LVLKYEKQDSIRPISCLSLVQQNTKFKTDKLYRLLYTINGISRGIEEMVSKTQIESALNKYCKSFEGHSWMLSDDQKRFVIKKPDGREIQVWQDKGKFRCSDKDIGMILMEMAPVVIDKEPEKAAENTEENLPARSASYKPASKARTRTLLDISEDKALAVPSEYPSFAGGTSLTGACLPMLISYSPAAIYSIICQSH